MPPPQEPQIDDAARPLVALTGDPPAAVVETCRRCHGEDGRGRGVGAYPRLAGQRREYLAAQLAAFALRLRIASGRCRGPRRSPAGCARAG